MNTFPLERVKWSNEHIMSAVFVVLILYHLPRWAESPFSILNFIAMVSVGLLIDAFINMLRYKRLVCAVSAAVTAAMLSALTYEVPLLGQLLGVVAALLPGKHIWGGTGKNITNPAIFGLLIIIFLFDPSFPFFNDSLLLIPGLLLGLPFIRFRPYAAIGFMMGMLGSMYISHSLTVSNILSYGVLFWGCLVLTDPVTVTVHPAAGAAAGIIAGAGVLVFSPSAIAMCFGVLAVNIFSYIVDSFITKAGDKSKLSMRIKKAVSFQEGKTEMLDLTGKKETTACEEQGFSGEEILDRIRRNEVFGLGGAAFSTYKKLMTVIEAKVGEKHLIINAVECDPGLVHDQWLLRNYTDEIRKGIELISRCQQFASITLAVKSTDGLNYPESVNVHRVPDCFPAGAEKILISEVLDKQMAHDGVPAAYGILVLNVQTVYSIYNAVYRNKKADTRFLTVANLKEKSAKVVKVKLSARIRDVIDSVYPGSAYVFAGGGLMQSYMADEEAEVGKTVNYIATAEFPSYKESPQCSKCGVCRLNCPMGLDAGRIAELVDQGDVGGAKKYHAVKCISCGSCSYSCLAGKNLSVRVKAAKEKHLNAPVSV